MEGLQYKLIDDGKTITIGQIKLDETLVKDYLNLGDILLHPCIELGMDNETKIMQLAKIKNQWIGTLNAFDFSFGIRIETLKNDKSKSSLYLKITPENASKEGYQNA
ncbi:hypothetical protein ND861_07115 [Leptospira sp. 2 VSF19]|uniref:Uncharacterized protein n=1 Tax=Leptospira soteropolitanensis TaxID=2950025 RepID=A0AAW5VJH2_9LEPT|nr:hypothetical protein [Leptospira soteropolitanensis]MCW7494662.1 hypothetical protein [Leptospira soteropolitanensis]MCW7500000.1 hypothetical protein [Leptospira soteropolitanensis]MCW7522251.1 hypothetical protein [Leptospira soteropolitanensis]MCW7526107.1 hypothetical protein [Leptospira soteropolitanensis]MCW7529781.1 hypothetical protein [Leptospira soteropolitanensis]